MQSADRPSLNRLAFSATTHCLTDCSIGEVLGMVIGTALGWGNWPTVVLSTVLAFVFGYLLRRGERGQATFSEAWFGPLPGLTRQWRTSGQRIRSKS